MKGSCGSEENPDAEGNTGVGGTGKGPLGEVGEGVDASEDMDKPAVIGDNNDEEDGN
jgi:hypothetical protein